MTYREKHLGFRQSHAFLIGIDKYPILDANLQNAVRDARMIAQLLKEKQSFDNVFLMEDVNKAQIEALLAWLANPERPKEIPIPNQDLSQHAWVAASDEPPIAPSKQITIDPDRDSILFYYAGHGMQQEINEGPSGFIVPSDARNTLNSGGLIAMETVYDALVQVNCKHTLLILDCCFAGRFRFAAGERFKARPRKEPLYRRRFERFKTSNAWQVLVSSGPEQTAADSAHWKNIRDNSPFADTFIKALSGEADLAMSNLKSQLKGDGVITASEVFLYVWDKVDSITALGGKIQHPGLFPMSKHSGGEFIFFNPKIKPEQIEFAQDEDNNPYKGLKYYEEQDSYLFFGRKKEIQEALLKIENSTIQTHKGEKEVAFLMVTGPSGVGKSSFIRAGLIPALKEKYNQDYELRVLQPGKLPFSGPQEAPIEEGNEHVFTSLMPAVEDLYVFPPKILLIDQLENIFGEGVHQSEKEIFLKRLNWHISNSRIHQLIIIFSFRSDYEWHFKQSIIGRLWKKECFYRLKPMVELDNLREVLTEPAYYAMYDFKDTERPEDTGEILINTILQDIVGHPGALPILSFTMQQFYEQARDTKAFLLSTYLNELKGVEGAISQHADLIYQGLSLEDQVRLRKLFIRLANVEGSNYIRRKVSYNEANLPIGDLLFEIDFGAENDHYRKLIQKMEKAFLLSISSDAIRGPFIEAAHDALLNHWDEARSWLEAVGPEQINLQRSLWQAVLEERDERLKQQNRSTWTDIRQEVINQKERDTFVNPPSTVLWNNNPKLDEIVNYLIVAFSIIALEENRQSSLSEWKNSLDEKDQEKVDNLIGGGAIFFMQDPFAINLNKISYSFLQRIHEFTQESNPETVERLLNWVLESNIHWLNTQEIAFIKASWHRRKTEIEQVLQERLEKAITQTAKSQTLASWANQRRGVDTTLSLNLAYAACLYDKNEKTLEALRYSASEWRGYYKEKILDVPKSETGIMAAKFSPDHQYFYLFTSLGHFYLRSISNDSEKLIQEAKPEIIFPLFYTMDENYINRVIQQLLNQEDIDQGELMIKLKEISKNINGNVFTFSNDYSIILVGEEDGSIQYASEKGDLINTFKPHRDRVNSIAISPNKDAFVSGGDDEMIVISSFPSGGQVFWYGEDPSIPRPSIGKVLTVDWSPDGKFILAGTYTGRLLLIDAQYGELVREYHAHEAPIKVASFSHDNKWIISGDEKSYVFLWYRDNENIEDLIQYGRKTWNDITLPLPPFPEKIPRLTEAEKEEYGIRVNY